ncbi:MAG: hypothetical protein IMY76_08365 [Chloroflexi bacterium]|nr:hypothetical protein [Chloroflexota bacterium]
MADIPGISRLSTRRRLENARLRLQREWRIYNLNQQVAKNAGPIAGQQPVVMFNASTRLGGFSQNAAFALLTAWSLQLAGVPVVHFACNAGMSLCVLGTNPDDATAAPPCQSCIAQSKKVFSSAPVQWFKYQRNEHLSKALKDLNIAELIDFQYTLPDSQIAIPLGTLTLPALRWALRMHHIADDQPTRYLYRQYIQSAYSVAVAFDAFLDQVNPAQVVVFNGIMFPEATARWIAKQRALRVITHEVGFQPFSIFFTDQQATAYPIHIPEDFDLSPEQNARLDVHLSQRLKGEFTMAGIRFWPEISGLSEAFLARAAQFKNVVPVFTNVVFDTSQVHANTLFPQMFAWLDQTLGLIQAHPETLFVIRAHPDEKRAFKVSRESVSDWVSRNQVAALPNVIFVDSHEPLSSYDLIQRSKFIMVYNSSIGLEGTLLGIPVLCGGQARYSRYATVFFPETAESYVKMAEEFLCAEKIDIPTEFVINARKFLYYQFFKVSLSFEQFLEAHPTPGYVQLKRFSWQDLLVENSPVTQTLVNGILQADPFLLPENE